MKFIYEPLKSTGSNPRGLKMKICSVCELPSDGNYCSRCGAKLV